MPMTCKEMAKLLLSNGFVELKCSHGSHRKYYNPITKVTIVILFHSKDLKKGLENAILKQAGLHK